MTLARWILAAGLLAVVGCGTTRWSDTPRTATEQLLLSDAVDRAVSRLDFNIIAGKAVYIDSTPVRQNVDSAYLISSVRQHLLASDCVVKDRAEDSEYVIEMRAGAIGTDRHDLLFGIPAMTLPASTPGTTSQFIPELPLAKRTEQRAVAKIALFVYNRRSGRPVWQSGVIPVESRARDLWVFGAGPFQQGSIYEGTKFAGQNVPMIDLNKGHDSHGALAVTQEAVFNNPDEDPAQNPQKSTDDAASGSTAAAAKDKPVKPASHTEVPADKTSPPAAIPAAPTPAAIPAQPALLPAGPSGTSSGTSSEATMPTLPERLFRFHSPSPTTAPATTTTTTTATASGGAKN